MSKSKEPLYMFSEHSCTVLVEIWSDRNGTNLKLKKTVLECSQKVLRGSLDFDTPWVACTITHSLHLSRQNWLSNQKDIKKKHT